MPHGLTASPPSAISILMSSSVSVILKIFSVLVLLSLSTRHDLANKALIDGQLIIVVYLYTGFGHCLTRTLS
jgi:hypothetical protein